MRQTEYPGVPQAYHKFQYPSPGYHLLRLQPEGPALRRPPRAPGVRPRHQQAGAVDGVVPRARRARPRARIRPGTWAVDRQGQALRLRASSKARGPPRRGGLDGPERRRDPEGRQSPFKFTIRTNQGNEERKKVAEIIQQRLKDVGVARGDPDHRVGRVRSRSSSRSAGSRRSCMGWGGGRRSRPVRALALRRRRGPDGLNHIHTRTPRSTRCSRTGRASCVRTERAQALPPLPGDPGRGPAVIFLYFRDALPAVASRVRGVEPAPGGDPLQLRPSGSCRDACSATRPASRGRPARWRPALRAPALAPGRSPSCIGITFISFMVIHLAPGEPVDLQTGRHAACRARPRPARRCASCTGSTSRCTSSTGTG